MRKLLILLGLLMITSTAQGSSVSRYSFWDDEKDGLVYHHVMDDNGNFTTDIHYGAQHELKRRQTNGIHETIHA